ncbi:MAG: protein kinase domain-containing protein [Acidobacteriota bacterium]
MSSGTPGQEQTLTFAGGTESSAAASFTLPERWRPARLLGTGGQAEVWLAFDAELAEWVAVKVFKGELGEVQRERLRREVKLGRSLSHPGLVRVFELIEGGDRLAVAMEWVRGDTLARRAAGAPLPAGEVIAVAERLLEILAFLHDRQIIHRDVKPSNLLIDEEGQIRLADLGLIRPLTEDADITRTAMTVGTPGYMSPEQVRGEELTPASDLYSLGITLFQLLTGKVPFEGRSVFEVAERQLRAAPPSPRASRPDCPAWLDRFVLRLLEKRPGDRFASAAAAREALLRRRLLISPRFWRRAGAAAVLVLAGGVATVALHSARRGQLSSVTIAGGEAVALDQRGRELWRAGSPSEPTTNALVEDLVGDGDREVAVAGLRIGEDGETVPRIAVCDRERRELAAFEPLMDTLRGLYSDLAPSGAVRTLEAHDLDGDGRPALVWTAVHLEWFPSEVGIWDLRGGRRPAELLSNSGHIHRCVPADLDGDGRRELLALGLNNPMGYQTVVATLRAAPHAEIPTFLLGSSPDLIHVMSPTSAPESAVTSYTVLGEATGGTELLRADASGILLRVDRRPLRLDAFGNPASSALFGKGPGPRAAFWRDMAGRCLDLESSATGAHQAWNRLELMHGDVLAEPASRLAAGLLLARSLARAGRHDEAVTFLRAAQERDPEAGDIVLRLGEQLFLAGRRDEAFAFLERSALPRTSGREFFDAHVALALGAALEGNRRVERRLNDLVSTVSGRLDSIAYFDDVRAFASFARGRWSDPLLETTTRGSLRPIAIAGLWAALERREDLERIEDRVTRARRNPESAPQAALLLARIELRRGRAPLARGLAEEALATLERRGRTSLESFAWVPLAHRVVADALAELGDSRAADTHMREARRLAPGCWFGKPDVGAVPRPTNR